MAASQSARETGWGEEGTGSVANADPVAQVRAALLHGPLTPRALDEAMHDRRLKCPSLELILGRLNGIGIDERGRLLMNEWDDHGVGASPAEKLGILSPTGYFEPLPLWGRFLLEVGAMASSLDGAWSWVLSLPTRSYAAALVAAGAVIASAHDAAATDDPEPWFRQLTALSEGTAVTIRDGEKLTKAVMRGTEFIDGSRYLVLGERGGVRKMPASQSLRITPIRMTATSATGAVRLADRQFLKGVLTNVDPLDFMRRSKLHCLICGGVNEVRADSLDPAFATTGASGTQRGRIQSVIRIARLVGGQGHFRSEIVAAGDRFEHEQLGQPELVIHNGADAYVRRRRFDGVPQVILLGRSDRQIETALSLVGNEYSQRRAAPDRPHPEPTAGVDQILFMASAQ